MPTVAIRNTSGDKVGEISLSEEVFGQEVNKSVLHEVVKAYLANQRQGTQSAKTRAQVSGGGIKPYRQKGTGRARQGSTRSPQWRHGGVVFAPKPRSYRTDVNKKVKRLALQCALSSKVAEESIIVLDKLTLSQPKTKEMVKVLSALNAKNVLLVLSNPNDEIERVARNIPGVKTTLVGTLNTYDVLKYHSCILTEEAVRLVEEVYAS